MHRSRQELEPSELTKARWKRIILGTFAITQLMGAELDFSDEGHVAGDKTSNAMRLAISLSVERRWLVSGSKYHRNRPVSFWPLTSDSAYETSSTGR